MSSLDCNVLFVCKGNICRSPLALAFSKKIVQERGLQSVVKLDSAGTENFNIGKPAYRCAVEASIQYGIDLSQHIAKQLNKNLVDSATHIMVMDENNLARFQQMFGILAASKCHLLGKYMTPSIANIQDPYKMPSEVFMKVAEQIRVASIHFFDSLSLPDGLSK